MWHDVDGDEWHKNKSQSYSCRKISLITNSEKFDEGIEGTKEWSKSNEDRSNASMGIEKKFRSTRIKNCFGINGFALCLAFKQRFEVTLKWPIVFHIHTIHSFWFDLFGCIRFISIKPYLLLIERKNYFNI